MKSPARGWIWCWMAAASAILASAGHCAAQILTNDDPSATYDPTPQRLVWPGVAVIVVVAIFVTAALAGPLIRANADQASDSPASSGENSE